MLKYILKRLLLIIPVVIGITLFIYLLLDLAPGDPHHSYPRHGRNNGADCGAPV